MRKKLTKTVTMLTIVSMLCCSLDMNVFAHNSKQIEAQSETISSGDCEEFEAALMDETVEDYEQEEILLTSSSSYNPSAALAYAAQYWNVKPYQVLCAEFVSNCINAGGISSSIRSARATVLRSQLNASGLGKEYACSFSSDGYLYKSNCPSVIAPGDVVFYYCPSCDDGKPYSIHVVLFNGFDSAGRMKAYSHNGPSNGASAYRYSTSMGTAKCYDCGNKITTVHVYHFNENNYNTLPYGAYDDAAGGAGTIYLRGWVFDPDNYMESLAIHIYVGGPAGVGKLYDIVANKKREDVVKAYPAAQAYCGFEDTIKVIERGTQDVYVYAIDAQDHSKHTLLGKKTVTISEVPFSIQFGVSSLNMKASESTEFSCNFTGDGIYTLAHTFSDYSVAKLPCVTNMSWSNGTCTVHVDALKAGSTNLTIYLMDSNNNQLYSKSIPVTVTQLVTGVSLNKTSTSLKVGQTEKLTAAVTPSDASNKNMTWKSSNSSVVVVSGGTITAKAAGTATITATAADGSGKKATCVVTVTKETVPFSITFAQDEVVVNKNNSSNVGITFAGENICKLGYTFGDSSIAGLTWGTTDLTKGTTSISVKGLKAGSTVLTIYLLDSSGSSLYTKSVTVNVKVPLQSISMNKTTSNLIVGKTDTLVVSYYPTDTTSSKSVTWKSSNTNVATVSGGKITAKAAGTAIITATASGKTATCTVTVSQNVVKVTKIALNEYNMELENGSSAQLTTSISPVNATNKKVTWSSSNTKVATVDDGMIQAINPGKVLITAVAEDGSGVQATCTVVVTQPVTRVRLNKFQMQLTIGESESLTAVIFPSNASTKTLTWSSSNANIATVSTSGLVEAVGEGTATITVKANNGVSAICRVTIENEEKEPVEEPVEEPVQPITTEVKLNKTQINIAKGKTYTLKATLTPSNSTDTIKWTSSNKKIATVSSKGKITAVKKGTVTITAQTSSGQKATCKVTVKEIAAKKIKLNKTSVTLKKGKSITLKATLTPKNSTDTIKWSSSNKKIAKVSNKGKVTAVKKGKATITAKTSSGKTVKCKVTVK